MHGLHHIRKRVCVTEGLEPFPARSTSMRVLDYVMYGVAFVGPLAFLPQIFQIYSTKSSEGVSLVTWVLLTISSALWLVYAAVHKDTHLFFASALGIAFHLVIVAGLLIY